MKGFKFIKSYSKISISIIIIAAALTMWFSFLLRDYAVDDAYITFRHARNLVEGKGFSFNGDNLLSTTAPLHGLLLAMLTWVSHIEIPKLAIAISSVSMVLLYVGITVSMQSVDKPCAGVTCVLFFASQRFLYSYYPLETVMILALNIVTIALALNNLFAFSGLAAGLAMVGRPDAVLLSAIVALYILKTSGWLKCLKFCITCAVTGGVWFGFAWLHYGSPFPNTLTAKTGYSSYLMYVNHLWPKVLSKLLQGPVFLSALIVIIAGVGCIALLHERSPLLILPAWGIAHVLGYTLLRISYPFSWYYAPVVLIVLTLFGVGLVSIGHMIWRIRSRWLTSIMMGILILVALGLFYISSLSSLEYTNAYGNYYWAGARDKVYRDVALWLRQNSSKQATVAVAESGTIGFYSDRYIIDLFGLVTKYEDIAKAEPDFVITVRNLPPDPTLAGLDNHKEVASFPKGSENDFEDIVILERFGP